MSEVTIGGDRLGSGNKMKASMRNFERSTHDLSYLWKSTMSIGTLVPFMSQVGLPGDTFDMFFDADAMTLPTSGPLFGNLKLQVDVFQVPIRLYNANLHMNKLGIGMKMNTIKLPQLNLRGPARGSTIGGYEDIDNACTNPSSILAYLGIRGNGFREDPTASSNRYFNAVPFLGYWDIYKQYYANKQEEVGVVIHNVVDIDVNIIGCSLDGTEIPTDSIEIPIPITNESVLIVGTDYNNLTPERIEIYGKLTPAQDPPQYFRAVDLFDKWELNEAGNSITFTNPKAVWTDSEFGNRRYNEEVTEGTIELSQFELDNIDDMREDILKSFGDNAYVIDKDSIPPYGLPFEIGGALTRRSILGSQEGLAIKTYNSDLFNNWISTEWIDGDNGISAITAIDTSEGNFTIDELNLSKKVYDMLNRIALSGGSYDDWLDAVYTHDRQKSAESPIYLGGMMQTISFQEVVSTSVVQVEGADPLGTLAGKGRLLPNKKGGKVVARIDEPSYIIGIISITPKVDTSQGNQWDVNLKTLDDLHKPSLDQIGYQDLITDQMAWFDTIVEDVDSMIFKSAGKQPAWMNYMTNVDVARGNFAIRDNQMFMTLNRKYEWGGSGISDLTTYIDPTKYNDIFADTSLDAQNFWVQLAVNITARRKMSAKIIPNL